MNALLYPSVPVAPTARQLQVRALQLGYGDWLLCQAWNQNWLPGLHLLQGGDGAGKSSLLRVLAGAQHPDAGHVSWSDAAIHSSAVFWIDPRQPQLNGSNVATPRQWARQQAQAYANWDAEQWNLHLQHWHLQADADKPWHALSTGTTRKFWMAAALSSGAELVLMDEPIAGLDRPSVVYLRKILAGRVAAALGEQRPQWLIVAHYDDLQGLPWDSVVELENLRQPAQCQKACQT